MVIAEFRGEYRWLSNFWATPIEREGRVYASVEHAYMAAKAADPAWKDYCASPVTPGRVKRASRGVQLVDGWDDMKLTVMEDCVRKKFSDPWLAAKLVATGDAHIQEGNTWGDKFWGVDLRLSPPRGWNNLGRIIMEVRSSLLENA